MLFMFDSLSYVITSLQFNSHQVKLRATKILLVKFTKCNLSFWKIEEDLSTTNIPYLVFKSNKRSVSNWSVNLDLMSKLLCGEILTMYILTSVKSLTGLCWRSCRHYLYLSILDKLPIFSLWISYSKNQFPKFLLTLILKLWFQNRSVI